MSLVVSTRSGRVEGLKRGGHSVFRGIPFGKPPTGKLRFRPPVPPEPWSGVRPAHEFGPAALQGTPFAPGVVAEGATSEDCLYLNVYTPAAFEHRRLPVMFWIHGGAFTVGSASMPLYDGGRLACFGDLVVVTINYRLGALGYLSLGEQGARWGASANVGQLDQIAALRWVRENIESFGGDPENVTIFGESAGATAVCALLATPSASSLFQRAIAESGSPALQMPGPETSAKVAHALLAALDLSPSESERLQDLPAEQIMKAQATIEVGAREWRGFFPVLDAATVPVQPREVLASETGPRVPLLIGTNRDEWNLFKAPLLRDLNKPMDDAEAIALLGGMLPAQGVPRASELLEVYRRSRGERNLPNGNRALLFAIEGDLRFRIPTIRFVESYGVRERRTHMYLFTFESPAMRGALRACHALEIPFVFGTLDAPHQESFVGTGPAVESLSRTMMGAWTSFARNGDPNYPPLTSWSPYEVERRTTMVFGTESRVESSPHSEELAAWEGIL